MKTLITPIKISLLSLTMLLSACATEPMATVPKNEVMPAKDRQQDLANFRSWNLSGKIAIRSSTDNVSASMNWKQSAANYTISVFGPLGAGSMTLIGQPGSVVLESSDGKKITASSPEALLAKQSGWRLPISNLYFWIRGMPAPNGSNQKSYDQFHHLSELNQAGWKIQYLNYTSAHGLDLPSKIFMNHDNLSIKIIVSNW